MHQRRQRSKGRLWTNSILSLSMLIWNNFIPRYSREPWYHPYLRNEMVYISISLFVHGATPHMEWEKGKSQLTNSNSKVTSVIARGRDIGRHVEWYNLVRPARIHLGWGHCVWGLWEVKRLLLVLAPHTLRETTTCCPFSAHLSIYHQWLVNSPIPHISNKPVIQPFRSRACS